MFTGIIEDIGKVAGLGPGGSSLEITSHRLVGAPVGSSVAVNGVCLTVVAIGDQGALFDVVPETLARSNLGALAVGDAVNLELAMAADGRFDGHIVQGHVDGRGTVVGLAGDDAGVILTVTAPESLMSQIAEKGSITIDGVSLTVAAAAAESFSVALIPHTLEVTTLGSLQPGDTVNLETDVIAKYVQRLVGATR